MMTEAEADQIASFYVWKLPRTPGSCVVQRPGWFQVISPDYPSAAFNEVIHSELSGAELEDVVLQTIETYRRIGTDFKWCTSPRTSPSDTGDVLRRHGFLSWFGRAMFARPSEIKIAPASSGISVRRLADSELDFFCDLYLRSWKLPADQAEIMKRQVLFDHQQKKATFERFVAYDGSTPVGVASMVRNSDSAYLHGTAVFPEFQGRGAYRALTDARMQVLRDNGVPLALTMARELTSAPRLEKLGFQTAWQTEIFLKKF
jgi:GNAT superfamily N-acetyltransferase